MDLSRAQQKPEALQNKAKKTEKKEKVDYTKIYWKPEVGKAVIRIVPSAYDKENPFSELLKLPSKKKGLSRQRNETATTDREHEV